MSNFNFLGIDRKSISEPLIQTLRVYLIDEALSALVT